jgi:hypothetical protein
MQFDELATKLRALRPGDSLTLALSTYVATFGPRSDVGDTVAARFCEQCGCGLRYTGTPESFAVITKRQPRPSRREKAGPGR